MLRSAASLGRKLLRAQGEAVLRPSKVARAVNRDKQHPQTWHPQFASPHPSGASLTHVTSATRASFHPLIQRFCLTLRSAVGRPGLPLLNRWSIALFPIFAVASDRETPEATAANVTAFSEQCLPSSSVAVELAAYRANVAKSPEALSMAVNCIQTGVLELLNSLDQRRQDNATLGGTVDPDGVRSVDTRWRPWRDGWEYRVVRHLNSPDDTVGNAQGCNSVVLHVKRGRYHYAIKSMINRNCMGNGSSREYLLETFGPEFGMPLHDHIVAPLHVWTGPSPIEYLPPLLQDSVADQTVHVLFPLMQGGSLESLMTNQKLLQPQAPFDLDWRFYELLFLQLLAVVDFLQEQGIVHGDLKPEQVLLDADGKAYVADWGESWRIRHLGNRVPFPDDVRRGDTPRYHNWAYMAPELRGRLPEAIQFSDELYGAAERWTVARIMYEVLREPGQDYPLFDKGLDVRSNQPSPTYTERDLPQLPAGTPTAFATVLRSLARCDPNQRMDTKRAMRLLQEELWGTAPADAPVAWAVQQRLCAQAAAHAGNIPRWEANLCTAYMNTLISA